MYSISQPLAILAAIAPALASPNPLVTAPAVLPRQLTTEVVGYFSFPSNGGWGSYWCNIGYKYCTSGNFGACNTITDTSCNPPQSCSATSYIVDGKGKSTLCNQSTNTVCATNFVVQSPGDTSSITSLVCRPTATPILIYRQFPTLGGSNSLASSTATPSPSSTLVSSTSSDTAASSTSTSTTTPDPTPAPKSKAWIAGPVIGGLVAIAAIVFGVLFLRRRKKASAGQVGSVAPPPNTYEQKPPAGVAYHDQKPPAAVNHAEQFQHHQQPYYPQSPQPQPQSPQFQYRHADVGHAELDGGVPHGHAAELGSK